MFEMFTAVMGLVGAGIFIAHAFEGVLSRARSRAAKRLPKCHYITSFS